MEKLSYSEQLKHPRWQKKRLKILQRDSFECNNCGSKEKTLHVHHHNYERGKMAWEYDDNLLSTLCEDCHKSLEVTKSILIGVIGDLFEYQLEEVIGYALAVKYEVRTKDGDSEIKTPEMACGWIAYFKDKRDRWDKASRFLFRKK